MTRAPGSYAGLTVAQANLLSFIRQRESDGITPSYDEMREHAGVASKSGVHRLITALEQRGYITRLYHRARSIRCNEHLPVQVLAQATTDSLIAELTARGYRFYGQSAEAA